MKPFPPELVNKSYSSHLVRRIEYLVATHDPIEMASLWKRKTPTKEEVRLWGLEQKEWCEANYMALNRILHESDIEPEATEKGVDYHLKNGWVVRFSHNEVMVF